MSLARGSLLTRRTLPLLGDHGQQQADDLGQHSHAVAGYLFPEHIPALVVPAAALAGRAKGVLAKVDRGRALSHASGPRPSSRWHIREHGTAARPAPECGGRRPLWWRRSSPGRSGTVPDGRQPSSKANRKGWPAELSSATPRSSRFSFPRPARTPSHASALTAAPPPPLHSTSAFHVRTSDTSNPASRTTSFPGFIIPSGSNRLSASRMVAMPSSPFSCTR